VQHASAAHTGGGPSSVVCLPAMGQKVDDVGANVDDEGDEEIEEAEGATAEQTNFADLLGPDCVIRRVDKDRRFLCEAKPEEMQRELMTRAATQKRLGACAEHVKAMGRDEKIRWAVGLKEQANQFYQNNQFEEAARLYNDCLVALDFEGSDEQNKEVAEKLQLPVCTNLAACTIEMGRYDRCIDICNIAISVDPHCAKAYYRRGLAYYRLGNHMSARPDFEAALREAQTQRDGLAYGEEPRALADVVRRATVYINNIRSFSAKERERCEKMFDQQTKSLYEDRPGAKPESESRVEEDFVIDDSDEAIEEALAQARGDCCRCCRRRRVRAEPESSETADSLPNVPKDKKV